MANKYMNKCSITIKEMQIKTTLRVHLIPVKMATIKKTTNAGEEMEEKEPSETVGGNINSYNHYGKHYGGSSKT
jgi:hypothetical protein